GYSSSTVPARFGSTNVNMSKGRISTNTTSVGHQRFNVFSDFARSYAGNLDVSSLTIAVLGICCTTNLLVVAGSTKRRSDGHSFAEVVTNFLQNIDQVRINKDWISVVLTTKLSNTKVLREELGSVFCIRVGIDCHNINPPSSRDQQCVLK